MLDLKIDAGYCKNSRNPWDEGWKVEKVYKPRVSSDWIREHQDDHRHQREASDI